MLLLRRSLLRGWSLFEFLELLQRTLRFGADAIVAPLTAGENHRPREGDLARRAHRAKTFSGHGADSLGFGELALRGRQLRKLFADLALLLGQGSRRWERSVAGALLILVDLR